MRVRTTLCVLAVALVSCSGDDGGGGGATAGPTTTVRAGEPVRVLTVNVLHGLFCPAETDYCQAPDRAEMIARAVEGAGCPELVGFQEIGPRQPEVLPPAMDRVCEGRYELAWQGINSPDRTMVFTTLPILDRGFLDLSVFPWEAYWVRVDAPVGAVDFLTAHFASSANNPPCAATVCPPVCPDGMPANECNAIEVVTALDAERGGAVLQIASGDLNARPGSPTLATFETAGFVDAWLSAGEPECAGAATRGCTGGRDRPENALDGLDVREGRYSTRIDYVLVRPGPRCTMNAAAAPFVAEPLARPFRGLYWPSDHAGVLAELACD
jgi:endonuclease/exonuclease/phosphatase family metal-dependent hydrolase